MEHHAKRMLCTKRVTISMTIVYTINACGYYPEFEVVDNDIVLTIGKNESLVLRIIKLIAFLFQTLD